MKIHIHRCMLYSITAHYTKNIYNGKLKDKNCGCNIKILWEENYYFDSYYKQLIVNYVLKTLVKLNLEMIKMQ